MNDKVSSSVYELLTWIAHRPRTYEETMAAWRSSCPRNTAWEDALMAGLLEVAEDQVSLTLAGRNLLAGSTGAPA